MSENTMKRYFFTVETTSVVGWQMYSADAASEAEALEIVKGGGGEFVEEELEVQDLGKYELCSVEDIPEAKS